jgi:transposase
MQEGQLLMTQAERDRLVTLKKAKKKLITQREAAEELGLSTRHVKRLLQALKKRGDKAVVHGLRGKPSNRRIEDRIEQEAVKILSTGTYRGFKPKLAAEYLDEKHGIRASKETVRKWMIRGKLWRGKTEKVKQVHVWRPRRSRYGELVQWDTSAHDWLEGRGERLYLIAMIDDATSRLFARFVRHDSTEENMKLLWSYLEKFGRPLSFYTDKASLFQTTEKRKRDEPGVEKDAVEMPLTQIGRALRELGITWIAAHSPQAKGRVERSFGTAQDRLVKGMRVAGVKTIEQANQYLTDDYLAWWERELTVEAVNPDDAHRSLEKSCNLAASLSHVEIRQVRNDYTLQWNGKFYQIERQAITTGLRKANVRIEQRLDGSLAVRHGERYLPVKECAAADKPTAGPPVKAAKTAKPKTHRAGRRGSDWNKNFDLKKAPKIWRAAQASGHRRADGDG